MFWGGWWGRDDEVVKITACAVIERHAGINIFETVQWCLRKATLELRNDGLRGLVQESDMDDDVHYFIGDEQYDGEAAIGPACPGVFPAAGEW